MATLRQKKVARKIVDNLTSKTPLTAGEILENVGYKPSIQKNPKMVLESAGVNEELKRYGFDSDKAKEVVGEILIAGENDIVKLKAADTIFKVNGDYAPEKRVNLNLDGTSTERTRELGDKLIQLLGRRD